MWLFVGVSCLPLRRLLSIVTHMWFASVLAFYSSIGQGSYGKVKLGVHSVSQELVAVKILQKDLMDAAELARAQREIEILKSLDHPNICKLLQVCHCWLLIGQ
jgi:hypothetical protein